MRINPNKTTPRHILIILSKTKEQDNVKSSKRSKLHVRVLGKLAVNLSAEILQPKTEWDDIFSVLKERNCQARSKKLLFRNEKEIDCLRQKAEGVHYHQA